MQRQRDNCHSGCLITGGTTAEAVWETQNQTQFPSETSSITPFHHAASEADADRMGTLVFWILAAVFCLSKDVDGKCPYVALTEHPIEMGHVLLTRVSESYQKAQYQCQKRTEDFARNAICDPYYPYRRVDNRCNNFLRPIWGTPSMAFQRLVPPQYGDGINSPRLLSVKGGLLPSPRAASVACLISDPELQVEDETRNIMFVFFGQFIDHDLTSVPEREVPEKCCPDIDPYGLHPDIFRNGPCFPIPVPPGDHAFNFSCIEFARSMRENRSFTLDNPGEQINSLTPFIDASTVYGSTVEEMVALRSFKDGRLLESDSCEHLPLKERFMCVVNTSVGSQDCHGAGDFRVNEVPTLTGLHLAFMRLHNFLATYVKQACPFLNDEKIFQEARKILIALHQQIVFYEWMPLAIGRSGMKLAGLDKPYEYESKRNPHLFNEFSTVCFRFGHTMLPSDIHTQFGRRDLQDTFFRPAFMRGCEGKKSPGMEAVINGMVFQPAKKRDRFFVDAITDNLFKDVFQPGDPPSDLLSRNLQRARDHGIPTYVQLVKRFWPEYEAYGGTTANFFQNCLDVYSNIYEDVDPFVGAMTEDSFEDSNIGFLCTRIIGEQFATVRNADRFFFETPDTKYGFESGRLWHIKQATIAWVLCKTAGIEAVPLRAFLQPSPDNPLVPCEDIPGPTPEQLVYGIPCPVYG